MSRPSRGRSRGLGHPQRQLVGTRVSHRRPPPWRPAARDRPTRQSGRARRGTRGGGDEPHAPTGRQVVAGVLEQLDGPPRAGIGEHTPQAHDPTGTEGSGVVGGRLGRSQQPRHVVRFQQRGRTRHRLEQEDVRGRSREQLLRQGADHRARGPVAHQPTGRGPRITRPQDRLQVRGTTSGSPASGHGSGVASRGNTARTRPVTGWVSRGGTAASSTAWRVVARAAAGSSASSLGGWPA